MKGKLLERMDREEYSFIQDGDFVILKFKHDKYVLQKCAMCERINYNYEGWDGGMCSSCQDWKTRQAKKCVMCPSLGQEPYHLPQTQQHFKQNGNYCKRCNGIASDNARLRRGGDNTIVELLERL